MTFTDEKFGLGASKRFTLFPGFWHDNQASTFASNMFQNVLGARERAVRKVLGKVFSDRCSELGIQEEAVAQSENHPSQVHHAHCNRGLRMPSVGLE